MLETAMVELLKSFPPDILQALGDLDLNVSSKNCNNDINSLLQRTVLLGGKRLRPLLIHLMGRLFGQSIVDIRPYAQAIEMVHAASLAHDDVVDNATLRRGRDSINIASSNKRAILAGDYLLADVIISLTQKGNLGVVNEMSKVIKDLSEGEWIQLDAAEDRQYTKSLIESIAFKKTASVMSWCCITPAMLAGMPEGIVKYSKKFGENIGLAFQLMDDTLDFSGMSRKDFQLDLENGLVNSVLFEWLELNPKEKELYLAGADLKTVWHCENLDTAIQIVEKQAKDLLREAKDILTIITKEVPGNNDESTTAKASLEQIIEYIAKRKY
jgi:geranylgeranyl pyrophosphate synthase